MNNFTIPNEIQFSENVLFQEIEGECVLLNMESEQYYGLNEVGSRFWQHLAEDGNTIKALNQLEAEFDVDKDTLYQDIANLIAEMKSQDLIIVKE